MSVKWTDEEIEILKKDYPVFGKYTKIPGKTASSIHHKANRLDIHPLVTDHLGNIYPTLNDMCKKYGISKRLYSNRKANGWTLERILTTAQRNSYAGISYKGKEYKSLSDLCMQNDLSRGAIKDRVKRGMKVEDAISKVASTQNIKKDIIKDHKGNIYSSVEEMAKAYNINADTLRNRINKCNWSIEKALTTPVTISKQKCVDYEGKVFDSVKEMCNSHGICPKAYAYRKKNRMES